MRTYAKDRYLEEATSAVERMTQSIEEDEKTFADRIAEQARVYAGVFSQQELITIFLRGVHPNIKSLLRFQFRDFRGPDGFAAFAERASAIVDAHRSLLASKPRKSAGVHSLEADERTYAYLECPQAGPV